MHEYSVELRIHGQDLNPEIITNDLGLTPSRKYKRGDKRGDGEWDEGMWGYDGTDRYDEPVYWRSLEEGLLFLLNKLYPVIDKLGEYRVKYELILWCGHFQSSFDGGPTFSPHLLKKLGEFGVTLFIDNYFSEPSEDETNDTA